MGSLPDARGRFAEILDETLALRDGDMMRVPDECCNSYKRREEFNFMRRRPAALSLGAYK